MADLLVEDATLVNAAAALRGATGRLSPVVRAVQALDAEVVGANPLATELDAADGSLTAMIEAVGTALTGLAADIAKANTEYGATDAALSREAAG